MMTNTDNRYSLVRKPEYTSIKIKMKAKPPIFSPSVTTILAAKFLGTVQI